MGRIVFIVGMVMVVAGGLLWLLGKSGLPLGRLPGDLRFEGQNLSCYAPVATMILLSILLTVVLNIVIRMLNR